MKQNVKLLALLPYLISIIAGCAQVESRDSLREKTPLMNDHFDGRYYFNPGDPPVDPQSQGRRPSWIWRFLLGTGWPEWPEFVNSPPGPPPPIRYEGKGALRITLVNHSTFLIQMDGHNILTDPIWSERCSPVSWAGPKRHRPPGIRFEDLPPIDTVLVSHNHYDHLDLTTLERLAKAFRPRALTTMGNRDRIRSIGFESVQELDWWQSVRLSNEVAVTVVPAQHFSSRTLWDRNETLWGGFVVSGSAGNVYFAGDTGYGPHFKEIARRFSPVRIAMLPISPFTPSQRSGEEFQSNRSRMHMGSEEAVKAHMDLEALQSLASHFQTFQLGMDGFDESTKMLSRELQRRGLKPDAFIAPIFGQGLEY